MTHTLSGGRWVATARHGCGSWTPKGPRQRSHDTSAHKDPLTSRWSWRHPSAGERMPMRGGTRGGKGDGRPCAGWGCLSDGSPGGVVGCESRWRPTTVTSLWPTTWSCRGPVPGGGMEWEWRVVSLKHIFPGELLALCVRGRDVGPEEELGERCSGDGEASLRDGVVRRDVESDPPQVRVLAQPCLSFGFARRVVCVCACVCAVSLCTCRAFLLVASRP